MTSPQPTWREALATVTACRYQFGAGRALAFGVPSRRHFLINFNYEVDGQMHTGQLLSATAMPQGHLFPIRFNPEQPAETATAGVFRWPAIHYWQSASPVPSCCPCCGGFFCAAAPE